MRPRALFATAALVGAVVGGGALQEDVDRALRTIGEHEIRAHLALLADDLFEGRAPATRGGALAARYLASQFERIGLQRVDGSYLQPVPLVGTTVDPASLRLGFDAPGGAVGAEHPGDVVLWTHRTDESVALEGEIVFAGYGVDADEYGWDDFGGRDLEGKILLVLVGDPPAPPEEPELFDGRAMTYYGRWSYKFEEARRRGAAGALIVHSTGAAGYPWSVVQSSWSGEQLALPPRADEPPPLGVEGWVTRDFARDLLERAGLELDELYVRAARRDFRPVATGITARAEFAVDSRRFETTNVAGLLPGSDAELRDEVIVYTSHYDHLGIGPPAGSDSIYNGAYDNASGVAVTLEIAEAFAALDSPPARSILFLATGAEEAGLLGSTHYVREPLVSLDRTVANLNIDGANLWGETDDVVAMGAERSSLGTVVARRAEELGLEVVPDRAPEKGFFFRSDHFPFVRAGVPAVYLEHGLEYRGRPADWGARILERYDAERYHRPGDEYDPVEFADLGGAVQQARLAFLVGYDIARAENRPRWLDGGEFGVGRGGGSGPRPW